MFVGARSMGYQATLEDITNGKLEEYELFINRSCMLKTHKDALSLHLGNIYKYCSSVWNADA